MRSTPKGFTILELIIAIGLLSIGIMLALASFPSLKSFHDASWEFKKAQLLASDKMEELLASSDFIYPGEEERQELSACKRTWKILKVNDSSSKLTVSVNWVARAQQKEIFIETLILQ